MQLVENLRIKAAQGEKEEDRKQTIGIVIEVGVISRKQAVVVKNLEANNAGDNFAGDVEIKEKIATDGVGPVRTHQYDHFHECAKEPNCVL